MFSFLSYRTCKALVVLAVCAMTISTPSYAFENWESAHVHPIDITPDMSTLLAVNTADHRLEVFDVVPGSAPTHRLSIPVGLDPVTVRARTDTEVWVVNHISDSISVVDLTRGIVVATLQTDDEPSDVVFAQNSAYVSCSQANTLMIFNPEDLDEDPQRIELAGEDPRSLAVSPLENRVYVGFFESGNGSTIIRGGRPQNGTPYGNALGVDSPLSPYGGINPPPNSGSTFSPAQNPLNNAPPPVGIIVKKDDTGRWMDDNSADWSDLVSGDNAGVSARVPGWDLPDNDIAIINTNTNRLVGYRSGLMNIITGLDFNPTSGRLAVVGTESHNEVRFEPNLRSHFATMQYADLEPEGDPVVNFRDLNSHLNPNVDTLPLAERANSIGDPRSITWGPRGNFGWVTGIGSNNILLVSSTGRRTGSPVEVGQGPTGIVFDESTTAYDFYVLNRFDATISKMNGRNTLATVPFFDPTPDYIKLGRPMLYDTHEGSGLGQVSCGTCHVDGRADRLAWDLGDPSADTQSVGIQSFHPMKGPLRTTSLVGIVGSESLHFRGDKTDLTAFAGTFTALQGLETAVTDGDMLVLEEYIAGIKTPPNPYRNVDNTMPLELRIPGADERVGNPNVANNCSDCHGGPNARDNVYRNNSANMPGGAFSNEQPAIAPSLVSMYEIFGLDYDSENGSTAGFGFIPDGSNDLGAGATLLNDDRVAFMMAFNGDREFDTHAAVGKQVTENNENSDDEVALLGELLDLAQDEQIGLIAKGLFRGQFSGFVFDSEIGAYRTTYNNNTWTQAQLLRHSGMNTRNLLTFTAVPYDERVRMGVDRDDDGVYNETDSVVDVEGRLLQSVVESESESSVSGGSMHLTDFAALLLFLLLPSSGRRFAAFLRDAKS